MFTRRRYASLTLDQLHATYEHRGFPTSSVRFSRPAISRRRLSSWCAGIEAGKRAQVLLGVTGSGKTFTMANVIAAVRQADAGHLAQQDAGGPALRRVQGVLSAQRGPLLRQLLRLLPARSVHPAARHLHREGRLDQRGDRPAAAGGDQLAGQPARRDHRGQRVVHLRLGLAEGLQGDDGAAAAWARRSTATRCCCSWSTFSTTATTSSSSGASSASAATASRSGRATKNIAFRIELWGDEVEKLSIINPISGEMLADAGAALHLPGQALRDAGGADRRGDRHDQAGAGRAAEDLARAGQAAGSPAAQRPHAVRHRNAAWKSGHCPGIENYSRPLSGRPPGSTPDTLYDFFPNDFLLFVDESHVTVPQIRAMYDGDRSRKTTLVEHGFRLPSALDNRPLKFDEWEQKINQVVFVSATPGDYELEQDRRRSRRAGHPADGPARSGDRSLARPAARCRTCSSRFASGPRSASGCWSRRSPSGWPKTCRPIWSSKAWPANGCTASSTPSSASSCCATCGRGSSRRWSA